MEISEPRYRTPTTPRTKLFRSEWKDTGTVSRGTVQVVSSMGSRYFLVTAKQEEAAAAVAWTSECIGLAGPERDCPSLRTKESAVIDVHARRYAHRGISSPKANRY